MAVPVRLTVCGDPEALSAMLTDATSDAFGKLKVVGLKVTVIVHVPLTATVTPLHVSVSVKEVIFVPVMEIPLALIISGAVPVFFTVMA